jgi:hypothetical protein
LIFFSKSGPLQKLTCTRDAASELNFSMSIAQDCAGEEMLAKRATKMAVFYR